MSGSVASSASPSIQGGLSWPDAVRGAVTCGVVVYHTALMLSQFGVDQALTLAYLGELQLTGLAAFFAISGMNGVRHIGSPFASLWARRLTPMLWMLLIWVVIHWSLAAILPNPADPDQGSDPLQIVQNLVLPGPILWYLWSLIAYLLLARLTRRLPPVAVLSVGLTLTAAMIGLTDWHLRQYGLTALAEHFTWRAPLVFFPIFYIGYRFRARILALSRAPLIPATIIFVSATAGLILIKGMVSSVVPAGVIGLAALLTSLVAAIFLARLLLLVPGLGRVIARIGRLSLPVYLAHMLVVTPLVYAARTLDPVMLGQVAPVLPYAIGLVALILSMLFGIHMRRLKLGWLFTPAALPQGQPMAAR